MPPLTVADEATHQIELDAKALRNLRLLDPTGTAGLLGRVLRTYRSSLARLLAQLDAAQARGDSAGIRLVVHTLKSSSASIGALVMSQLCGAAEAAVRDGQDVQLTVLLTRLRVEAVQVDLAVHALLAD